MPSLRLPALVRQATSLGLATALALALLTTGCVGSADPVSTAGEETSEEERPDAQPASEQAPTIERTYEDSGLVGVPLLDPGHSTGSKATFAKTSYENGANGTWLLGYEIAPTEEHDRLAVEAEADGSPVPDYDLFVFGPSGELVGDSANSGTDEGTSVEGVEAGEHLVLLYFFAGADAAVTTTITAR